MMGTAAAVEQFFVRRLFPYRHGGGRVNAHRPARPQWGKRRAPHGRDTFRRRSSVKYSSSRSVAASAVNARCPSFGGSVDGRTCGGGGSDSSKRVAAGACAMSYARGAAAAKREVPFFDAPPPPPNQHASPTTHRHTRSRPLDGTRRSGRDLRCTYITHYIYYVHFTQRAPDSERTHILLLCRLRATTAVHRIDSAATAPAVVVCALVAFPAMQS